MPEPSEAEAILFRASNYQVGVNGYKYIVGPYTEISEDMKNITSKVNVKRELENLWDALKPSVVMALFGKPVVLISGPDYDVPNGLIFIDLASPEAEPLVEVLKTLSKYGWTTGVR